MASKATPPQEKYPRLHRDGTISYWSYFQQTWVERAFYVPLEEVQMMDPYDRRRIEKHLGDGEAQG